MLHNIKTECSYHQILNSTQMSDTESWKLLLSKFFVKNQIIKKNHQSFDNNKTLDQDNQTESEPTSLSIEPQYISESMTPHSNLTSTSNNSIQRPKSSISRESWPNTSDDGSISRQTPESSFEEFSSKAHEFSLEERNNTKFLKSLLIGGDPNQIKSYSSLLTSRVAMCNNLNFIQNNNNDQLNENKISNESILLDKNSQVNSDHQQAAIQPTNNIDDMLLYLLKFLRNKMEIQQQQPTRMNFKKKSLDNFTDGSLLANLINESDNSFDETGDRISIYQLSSNSQKELKVIRKKISNEYSSLFKLTGHSKSIVSRNLEARLTILEMLKTRTCLNFERASKPIANGLPLTIVRLFKTVLDDKFPLISEDENIFRILQSAVISQECYPRIVTNTCQSIMRKLHEYLLKIEASERFIDFLLLMTNINSINLSHFHILYNSLLPIQFPQSIEEQINISRKRRASRQYYDE